MMLTTTTTNNTPAFLSKPPPPQHSKKSATDDSLSSATSKDPTAAESLRKRHSFASLRAMRNAEAKIQDKSNQQQDQAGKSYTTENAGERGRLRNQKSMEKPPWNPSFHVQAPAPPLPPLNRTRTINPKYAPPPPRFIKKERSLTPKRSVVSPPLLCSPGSTPNSSCTSQKSEESTSPQLTQRRLTVAALPSRPWDSTTSPINLVPAGECDYKKLNAMKYTHVQSKVSNLIKAQKPSLDTTTTTTTTTAAGGGGVDTAVPRTERAIKKTVSLNNVTPNTADGGTKVSLEAGVVVVVAASKKENVIGVMRKAMSTVFSSSKRNKPPSDTPAPSKEVEEVKVLKKQPSLGTLKPKKATFTNNNEPIPRTTRRSAAAGEPRPYSSNLCVNPPPVPTRSNRRARASLGKIDLESVRPPSENLAAVSETSSKQISV